jgi:uncharacterized membrane protein
MIASHSFYFAQPWWLTVALVLVPMIYLARRHLAALGSVRRICAVTVRSLVILLLIALLARPHFVKINEQLTLIAVMDRSRSVPKKLGEDSYAYMDQALSKKNPDGQLAVIDIAEIVSISKLPSGDLKIHERNTMLTGMGSHLSAGVQMAMAIAPPDTANRILLVSDGNETAGDLKEAATLAAANGIPVDVLPLQYEYDREVVFKRLAAPTNARSGQTIGMRFILGSTAATRGRIELNLNGTPVDLDPDSDGVGVAVDLKPGTNVQTLSLPMGARGMHDFEATFIPDDPASDRVSQNNRAGAMTYVAGPGNVMVVDNDGLTGPALAGSLRRMQIEVEYTPVAQFPGKLSQLMDTDAVVLVNISSSSFTYEQQEMLSRYVTDMGGGLVMIGGSESFGAGGWIGSPVADILPVDLDPPQKKQMPKGALVLILHACEIPAGNMWSKKIAVAAVNSLSKKDLVGIVEYKWQDGDAWAHPLSEVGDRQAVLASINNLQLGDMPDLHSHLQEAYNQLKTVKAGQKHVVVISDGDPQPPTAQLLNQMKQSGITCSGIVVNPHSPADKQNMLRIAEKTGGRYYDVKDASKLPQIFIKEAQVVRRALIVEESFSPILTYSLNEITRGVNSLPNLDGYILTGPKGGLSQVLLSSHKGDPILATAQSGLGRCVAFTSSVDSRWASSWQNWSGYERFWEQVIRWVGKSVQSSDFEVYAEVQGRNVNVQLETYDKEGDVVQLARVDGLVIAPDMTSVDLVMSQKGPGQYEGQFQTAAPGNYIINLRHKKTGDGSKTRLTQIPVSVPFAPEFRDLTDNTSLMKQISELTGGRVLGGDPTDAHLFDTAGVKFPQTQVPLNKYLMLIWLALFLLDVAVRRLAFDIKAIVRKVTRTMRFSRSERKREKHMDQLQETSKKIRQQLEKRSQSVTATRRYEAEEETTDASELPVPQAPAATLTKEAEKSTQKSEPQETEEETDTHINRLLKAKRKVSDKDKGL